MIGVNASQFRGSDQQDSQEFLAFLLDMLHEDMNKARGGKNESEDDNDNLPEHVSFVLISLIDY